MNPVKVNAVSQAFVLPSIKTRDALPKPDGESFGNLLKSLVQDVNGLQKDAAGIEKKFLAGEVTDVHQVMLASEEASVAFELFLEIRNKLIESYKEIIRTPA